MHNFKCVTGVSLIRLGTNFKTTYMCTHECEGFHSQVLIECLVHNSDIDSGMQIASFIKLSLCLTN
jgi:hypothetical protein